MWICQRGVRQAPWTRPPGCGSLTSTSIRCLPPMPTAIPSLMTRTRQSSSSLRCTRATTPCRSLLTSGCTAPSISRQRWTISAYSERSTRSPACCFSTCATISTPIPPHFSPRFHTSRRACRSGLHTTTPTAISQSSMAATQARRISSRDIVLASSPPGPSAGCRRRSRGGNPFPASSHSSKSAILTAMSATTRQAAALPISRRLASPTKITIIRPIGDAMAPREPCIMTIMAIRHNGLRSISATSA